MTDSKRISGTDILAMRSQAAEAENYAIIARANIDRLTRAYAALEIEVVKLQARLEAAEKDAERPPKMPNRMPLPHQSACDIEYSSGFDMGYAQGWNEAIDAMKEQQP